MKLARNLLMPRPASSLSLSEERVRERFHATYAAILVQPTIMAALLALDLSRRDRSRADLSSDK